MSSAITQTRLYSESAPSRSVPAWQEDTETPRALLLLRPGPQRELGSAQDRELQGKRSPSLKTCHSNSLSSPNGTQSASRCCVSPPCKAHGFGFSSLFSSIGPKIWLLPWSRWSWWLPFKDQSDWKYSRKLLHYATKYGWRLVRRRI